MPVGFILGRLRQKDLQEIKASLVHIVNSRPA